MGDLSVTDSIFRSPGAMGLVFRQVPSERSTNTGITNSRGLIAGEACAPAFRRARRFRAGLEWPVKIVDLRHC